MAPLGAGMFWWFGIAATLFASNLIGFHLLMIPSEPRIVIISSRRFVTNTNGLARGTRLSEMGELAASIAHEVNQPLRAIVANATAQRYLTHEMLDLDQIGAALEDVAWDGKRASDVISRTRGLFERTRSTPRRYRSTA